MTEQDWMLSQDPLAVLAHFSPTSTVEHHRVPSVRRLRQLANSACRVVWKLLPPDSQLLVECAEWYVDGDADLEELGRTWHRASNLDHGERRPYAALTHWITPMYGQTVFECLPHLFAQLSVVANTNYRAQLARLIREVLGNPWKPLDLEHLTACNRCRGHCADSRAGCCHVPFRLTSELESLATATYNERASTVGALDPVRLGILADALEEAGCPDGGIPGHLRNGGPHVRGCYVLELFLPELVSVGAAR